MATEDPEVEMPCPNDCGYKYQNTEVSESVTCFLKPFQLHIYKGVRERAPVYPDCNHILCVPSMPI